MPFGVTAAGFVKKTLLDLKAELEGAWKATFGASINLDPRSRNGQVIGIFSERLADVWDLGQALDAAFDPDRAAGVQLDNLSALTGTVREPATKSTAIVYATGTPGTIIAAGKVVSVPITGTKFQTLPAAPSIAAVLAWAISTAYAIGAIRTANGRIYRATVGGVSAGAGIGPSSTGTAIVDGTVTWRYLGEGTGYVAIAAEATETGPKIADAYSLTVIETPVFGWDSATNVLDADPGQDVETDAALRVRREDELRTGGKSPLEAIRAALLDVDDVTAVTVFENITSATDADGVPPHSVEVMVQGGADADILAAVFASVAGGIGIHGTTSGIVTDSQGIAHTVKFTRPAEFPVNVIMDVLVDAETFPSDGAQQIKDAIVAWGDLQKAGKNVVASAIGAQAFKVSGVLDVPTVLIDDSPGPVSSVTLPVSLRELATYDTSRITVNVTTGVP